MEAVRKSIENIYETVTRPAQSGTEPPSGVSGTGTTDQPYDQGNAPEQPTAPSTEPPSGVRGTGTADQPYDRGNAPEQPTVPGTEPPSGLKGEGTASEPYDQGNQPDQAKSTTLPSRPSQASPTDPTTSTSPEAASSTASKMEPATEKAAVTEETRGRDDTVQRTTSTPDPAKPKAAPRNHFGPASDAAGGESRELKYEERDVSPGEMRDGTHATTSGERGESYTPGKMNKLKDRFGIGRDRK